MSYVQTALKPQASTGLRHFEQVLPCCNWIDWTVTFLPCPKQHPAKGEGILFSDSSLAPGNLSTTQVAASVSALQEDSFPEPG